MALLEPAAVLTYYQQGKEPTKFGEFHEKADFEAVSKLLKSGKFTIDILTNLIEHKNKYVDQSISHAIKITEEWALISNIVSKFVNRSYGTKANPQVVHIDFKPIIERAVAAGQLSFVYKYQDKLDDDNAFNAKMAAIAAKSTNLELFRLFIKKYKTKYRDSEYPLMKTCVETNNPKFVELVLKELAAERNNHEYKLRKLLYDAYRTGNAEIIKMVRDRTDLYAALEESVDKQHSDTIIQMFEHCSPDEQQNLIDSLQHRYSLNEKFGIYLLDKYPIGIFNAEHFYHPNTCNLFFEAIKRGVKISSDTQKTWSSYKKINKVIDFFEIWNPLNIRHIDPKPIFDAWKNKLPAFTQFVCVRQETLRELPKESLLRCQRVPYGSLRIPNLTKMSLNESSFSYLDRYNDMIDSGFEIISEDLLKIIDGYGLAAKNINITGTVEPDSDDFKKLKKIVADVLADYQIAFSK